MSDASGACMDGPKEYGFAPDTPPPGQTRIGLRLLQPPRPIYKRGACLDSASWSYPALNWATTINCQVLQDDCGPIMTHHGFHPISLGLVIYHPHLGQLIEKLAPRLALDGPVFSFRCDSGQHWAVAVAHLISLVLMHRGWEVAMDHFQCADSPLQCIIGCKVCKCHIGLDAWNALLAVWDRHAGL